METRKSDDYKIGESFAIGSKIDYMNKLYEIVENNYCGNCSISDICCNSDVSNNNIDNVLSRDERIKIFGECSPIKRKDHKSVVFKEISADDDDVYDVEVLYKNDKELLPIRINIPSGYTIDIENSDLANNIIKFKRKWLSIEQLYKLAKESNHVTHRDSIKYFSDGKLIALANLMDIARYFNGDWKYDITKEENIGYMIVYDGSIEEPNYTIHKIEACSNIYYGNVIFKNKDDAKYVIDNPNFRNILDKIFKV